MTVESITNYVKVDDRIGTAGQPTRAQLEALAGEGYRAVINLAPGNNESHALPGEQELVESLGMTYHHIPIPWDNPNERQFGEFVEVMRGLGDKKVFVHCAANFRVTAFFSLYAMKHLGWTARQGDDLLARIWESRPDYRMDDNWQTFIARVRANIDRQS